MELSDMEQTIHQFMNRHRLIHKGATVLIGVSGGPDSMALLHVYSQLRSEWDLRIIALAVNHQLRGDESEADIAFVRTYCEEQQIEFVATSVDVPAYRKREKISTQVAARTLRYQFFQEQMGVFDADYLALGHHADDQVETMAMRFVHQTNPRAAAGIPVKRPLGSGMIVRPLLSVTKEAVYAYCETYEIPFRIDPSNEDDSYERNYFRKHIVPLLIQRNPNVQTTMQQLSERLIDDEQYMQQEAQKLLKTNVSFRTNERKAVMSRDTFLTFPIALQRRVYHLLLNYLYDGHIGDHTYMHEQSFFDLCHNENAHVQMDLPDGRIIAKVYEDIHLFVEDEKESTRYEYELPVPGEITLPAGDRLEVVVTKTPPASGKDTYVVLMKDVQLPLYVRTRQDGDRMSWKGLQGTKKLKDLFMDVKIPRQQRDEWPIVIDAAGQILWVVNLRKARIGEDCLAEHTYMVIRYTESNERGGEERA